MEDKLRENGGNASSEKEIKVIRKEIYYEEAEPSPDGALTFKNIWKTIKNSALRILVYVIIVSIVLGISCSFLAFKRTNLKYADTLLELKYDGVENGLLPNGELLDLGSILKSPTLIDSAIERSGLKDKLTNTDDVASAIIVTGVVPTDIRNKIAALEKQAEKDPTVLNELNSIKYFCSRFTVRFVDPEGAALSETELSAFLTALNDSFMEWFKTNYITTNVFSTEVFDNAADANFILTEYWEYSDKFVSTINNVTGYLKSLDKVSEYRDSNGNTVNSLLEKIALQNNSMDKYLAYVIENSIAHDEAEVRIGLQHKLTGLENSLKATDELIKDIKAQLDAFKPDTTISGSGEDKTTTSSYSKEYGELQNKLLEQNELRQRINSEINTYTSYLNKFNVNAAPTQAQKDRAEEMLKASANAYIGIINEVNSFTKDFNEKIALKNAVETVKPVSVNVDSEGADVPFLLIFAAGIIAAIAAAMIVTVIRRKRFTFRKAAAETTVTDTACESVPADTEETDKD